MELMRAQWQTDIELVRSTCSRTNESVDTLWRAAALSQGSRRSKHSKRRSLGEQGGGAAEKGATDCPTVWEQEPPPPAADGCSAEMGAKTPTAASSEAEVVGLVRSLRADLE